MIYIFIYLCYPHYITMSEHLKQCKNDHLNTSILTTLVGQVKECLNKVYHTWIHMGNIN